MEVKFFDFDQRSTLSKRPASSSGQTKVVQNSGPVATFVVLRAISRASLSLSWLDVGPSSSNAENVGPKLFSCRNSALEELLEKSNGSPSVLLAKDKTTGRLCAIEKTKENVYALCWIGSWIQEEQLEIISPIPHVPRSTIKRKISHEPAEWWKPAVLFSDNANREHSSKRVKLDLSKPLSVSQQHSRNSVTDHIRQASEVSVIPFITTNDQIGDTGLDENPQLLLDKEQFFENLVCQYLEALYLNRTPLSFFAKGPLSRIRTAFIQTNNEALSLHDLTTFLRTMILTLAAMDKKFKEKLPDVARSLALDFSDDDGIINEKKGKRKAKKKKLKISKEGIYPFESEYMRKWWRSDEETHPNPDETGEQRIRRRVGDLRVRETLIQIILMFEITALENSTEWKAPASQPESETQDPAPLEDLVEINKLKPRRNKAQNLDVMLDLLIDKLAIWQSVETDSQLFGTASDAIKDSANAWNKDRLESFCVEVIVPL
jgi:DNA replication regulator SLD3